MFRANPLRFADEELHLKLDAWQVDALKSQEGFPRSRRRLGLKACTGPGKSLVEAIIGWWRLACFGEHGEHPKGAALSGEGRDNLRDNLWAELSKVQKRSEYLTRTFTWNQERIYANAFPETWFCSARSYPKDANSEAIGRSLSGLHSKYPFLLLDEVGEMPLAVGQKAEQIFTGNPLDALIVAAGNPTSTSGLLYQIFVTLRELWEVITITADPDDPKRTPRVDIEHARQQIRLYGRDNPWVMATILGEFPPQGFNTLLTVEQVEAAMKRHYREADYMYSQKRLGVDVARFGDDKTIIMPRQGLVAFKPAEMRNARSHEIAARVAVAKAKWGSEMEFIDDTGGWGSGVIDSLLQSGISIMPINFSGRAMDPRYFNIRAEMWWSMAEWVKRGGALPPIPSLVRQLTQPTYYFQAGKLRLEEKEQIKKRLGFSPDEADALGLTFAMPDMPATLSLPFQQQQERGKCITERPEE